MRIIKFRAKDENGKWVYGSILINYYDRICDSIVSADIEGTDIYNVGERRLESALVNYDTIGQFTGLCDSKGNQIYEGDILRFGNSPSGVCEVKWNKMISAFCIRFYFEKELGVRPLGEWAICERSVEIIGNIYDNPELLEGDEK